MRILLAAMLVPLFSGGPVYAQGLSCEGGHWVFGGGGQECQCPDGSFANMRKSDGVIACPSHQYEQPKLPNVFPNVPGVGLVRKVLGFMASYETAQAYQAIEGTLRANETLSQDIGRTTGIMSGANWQPTQTYMKDPFGSEKYDVPQPIPAPSPQPTGPLRLNSNLYTDIGTLVPTGEPPAK